MSKNENQKLAIKVILMFVALILIPLAWQAVTAPQPEITEAAASEVRLTTSELQVINEQEAFLLDKQAQKEKLELEIQQTQQIIQMLEHAECSYQDLTTCTDIIEAEAEVMTREEFEESKKAQGVTVQNLSQDNTVAPSARADKVAKTQAYIDKYSNNSPLTGEMLVKISEERNFPVSFMLAVAHNESHFGTKGRAVGTNNPYNVGNTDAGDYKAVQCGVANWCLESPEQGVHTFVDLISTRYFNEGEQISLQTWIDRDFRAVNGTIAGKRYQTDKQALVKYQERLQNLQQFNINF